MKIKICRMKSYIQPFERQLALHELATVCGIENSIADIQQIEPFVYKVKTDVSIEQLVDKLSYWESITDSQHIFFTRQVIREATVNIARNGITLEQIKQSAPINNDIPIPNRRCLRYGTHGIHEYRGKFFPQLVRALINISGISIGSTIADPMSGSGTTIVEACLSGYNAIGLDMNPLSVLMGKTKCALMAIDPDELATTYNKIHQELLSVKPLQSSTSLDYFINLPSEDKDYLREWFSEQVLVDLDQIATRIQSINNRVIQDFMWLSLSNIIRKVSWQKDDDLRVRKEIHTDIEIDPIKEFLEELSRSTRTVLSFLYQNSSLNLSAFNIIEGDARKINSLFHEWESKVDCVITSPPYATALPYLDTDRLSLGYLGLLSRSSHRLREKEMIGNRELTEKQRQIYWKEYEEKKLLLPLSVTALIDRINRLNSNANVGFRRKNLSALLSKYFFDMRQVMIGIHFLLKPNAAAFIVVGNNRTIAGGEEIDIKTADLLVDISTAIGLKYIDSVPMDMLTSRDIFKKNAMSSEVILCFRK